MCRIETLLATVLRRKEKKKKKKGRNTHITFEEPFPKGSADANGSAALKGSLSLKGSPLKGSEGTETPDGGSLNIQVTPLPLPRLILSY